MIISAFVPNRPRPRQLSFGTIFHPDLSFVLKSTSSPDASQKARDDSTTPAKFQTDLYAVLGVLRNSSREEIRDAYWSIAAKHHPDRSDSQESLEIFRNASNAYKILGRDPKTRAEYDNMGRAERFVSALGEVGTDILVPLARDVAFPLINVTVRGIGSIARPFVRDIIDTSNAVVQALQDDDSNSVSSKLQKGGGNVGDYLNLAVNVFKEKSFEQNVRRYEEKIATVDKKIAETMIELEKTVDDEKSSAGAIRRFETSFKAKNLVVQKSLTKLKTIERDYMAIQNDEALAGAAYRAQAFNVDEVTRSAKSASNAVDAAKLEVQRLEEALNAAKYQLKELQAKDTELQSQLSKESSSLLRLEITYNQTLAARDKMYVTYSAIEMEQAKASRDLSEAMSSYDRAKEENGRQKEYIEVLRGKIRQLSLKAKTFDDLMKQSKLEWNESLKAEKNTNPG